MASDGARTVLRAIRAAVARPMPATRPPIALLVLDGWGLSPERRHNAIALGRTPAWTELLQRYPHGSLVASGEAVGLPTGQMGNSEVGHMNLGAGRIVYQDLTRIDKSIADGDFFENRALANAMARGDAEEPALHLIGLVSAGGVHSHLRHLVALVDMARRRRVKRLFVHVLTDGRDCAPTAASGDVATLERELGDAGVGRVATVCGRYYGMDRDRRWDRTQRAYEAIVHGRGRTATDAATLVQSAYSEGVTDEFIEPGVVVDADGVPIGRMRTGDAVIFFNFRADRARQLTRALALDDDRFSGFARRGASTFPVTTLTEYDPTYGLPVAFDPLAFSRNVAEVLAAGGRTNLRLAETEKYAHVTYFFNSGVEPPYAGEDRILVPSPKVPTYDLQPEMSAEGITAELLADVAARRHEVIICNFANADMVGHTGKLDAAVAAVSTLDRCLARIVRGVTGAGGSVLVTADHGNAEQMWDDKRNGPHTAHTTNPVPVVLVDPALADKGLSLRHGGLRDVAPTLLHLAGLRVPAEMTGRDLRSWVD